MKIKALILDADGVIFEKIFPKLDKKLAEECHVTLKKVKESKHKYWALTKIGRISSEEMWHGNPSLLGFKKGILREIKYSKEKRKDFHVKDLYAMMPKALVFLKRVHQKKIKLYLLSNSSEDFTEKPYEYFHLNKLFTDAFFSHRIGVAKPELKLFNKVLKSIPYSPQEILFVDDKEKNIHAAQKVALQTYLFASPKDFLQIEKRIYRK